MSDNLSFDSKTNVLTVGHVEGVDYLVGGRVVSGEEIKLTKNTVVTARPQPGKVFPRGTVARWKFEVNKDLIAQERAEAVEESLSARQAARQATRQRVSAEPSEPVQTDRDAPRDVPSGASGPAVNPAAGSNPPVQP